MEWNNLMIVEVIKALIRPFPAKGALEQVRQEWYKNRIAEAQSKGDTRAVLLLQEERDRVRG